MKKPTLGFSNLNPAELRMYAEQILNKMTAATETFATPVPNLDSLRDAIQIFSESISEAAFNDRRAIVFRDQKRWELERIVYELSKYVDSIANGNEETILLAGFIPSQSSVSGSLKSSKPTDLRATPSGIGTNSVLLRVKPWYSTRIYQFEYRKRGTTENWTMALSTKSTRLVENLETFQEYEFRVTYVGTDTTPNYSDVISTYAL